MKRTVILALSLCSAVAFGADRASWQAVALPKARAAAEPLAWGFDPVAKSFYCARPGQSLYASHSGVDGWTPVGKGRFPGEALQVTRAGLFAVSRASNTIWSSRDRGRTWHRWPARKNVWRGSLVALSVDPGRPTRAVAHVFLKERETTGAHPLAEGLWRTDDGGQTFHALALHADRAITAVQFYGARGCVVFHEGSLFCSSDNGRSWKRVPLGPARAARDVAVGGSGETVLTDKAVLDVPARGEAEVIAEVDGPHGVVADPLRPRQLAFIDRAGERIFVLNEASPPAITMAEEPVRALAAVDFERGRAIVGTADGGWSCVRLERAARAAGR